MKVRVFRTTRLGYKEMEFNTLEEVFDFARSLKGKDGFKSNDLQELIITNYYEQTFDENGRFVKGNYYPAIEIYDGWRE